MKITITGSGMIPGVNAVPPVRGIELDERTIRNLLNYPRFRLFQTSTGFSINRRNIDKILKSERNAQKAAPVVETVKEFEAPKTVVEEPVVETPAIETVQEVAPVETHEEPNVEFIPTESEIVETAPVVEEEIIEEAPVEETVEEVVTEEVTEEPKEETTEEKKPYYNKKKKNRH